MSFNVKHYVAIGLGFAVFAGYAMHKSASPSKPVAFETGSGEFRPLSSFEHAIGEVPRIASIQPAMSPLNNKISTSQLAIETEPRAQQVAFDTGDPPTNDLGFAPEFVNDAITELADIIPEDSVDREVLLDESTTIDLAAKSALVATEPSENVDQKAQRRFELPNSQWKRNPFTDPAIVDNVRTPAVDIPMAEVSELASPADSSIIVEPVLNSPSQHLAEVAESVDLSLPTTLESEALGSASLDLASNENQIDVWQSNKELTDSSDVSQAYNETTSVVEIASESSNHVSPLKIPLSEAAAQQAVHHIEYGKSLSRRGAAFAARQEFYSALRVIAESNDAITGTNDFSRALSQAILAMREARDFVQNNSEAELLLDVASITEPHRSKIIDKTQAASTSPAQALQTYFVFAQKKLDEASGRNIVSAEALFCLGKLHTTVSKSKTIPDRIEVARGIAYHQAALMSDETNFRSANELGVLLAQMGQLEQATDLFKRSLIAQPTPQAWQNLATTHRRLGEQQLAQLAQREYSLLSQMEVASSNAAIRWVPTKTFSAKQPMEFHNNKRVALRPESPSEKPKITSEKVQTKIKSFGERLKELF